MWSDISVLSVRNACRCVFFFFIISLLLKLWNYACLGSQYRMPHNFHLSPPFSVSFVVMRRDSETTFDR